MFTAYVVMLVNVIFFQIKALRRERVETILGKEGLVDEPAKNGIKSYLLHLL